MCRVQGSVRSARTWQAIDRCPMLRLQSASSLHEMPRCRELGGVVDHLSRWTEGCPCHSSRSQQLLPQAQKCPYRGCRGPELAFGQAPRLNRFLQAPRWQAAA